MPASLRMPEPAQHQSNQVFHQVPAEAKPLAHPATDISYTTPTMASNGYDVDHESLGLSAERFEAFVGVFRQFDKANTGAITTKQLEALCFKLGESFDDEELAVAKASLENEQTGLIHFAVFLPWWISE